MNLEKMVMHPDKVFWPEEGYTKLDVARFYEAVFPRLKPYLDERLLTMERCPEGMRGECFYQKRAPKGLPAGTPTKSIHHGNDAVNYVVGGALETQIALVNLGCIPVHVWGSRADRPEQPDWMVFDLDPGSGKFSDSARAGLLIKTALDELGLISFPKTSGSRGLHVFVPLRRPPVSTRCAPSPPGYARAWRPSIPIRSPWSSTSQIGAAGCFWMFCGIASARPSQRPIRCGVVPERPSRSRSSGGR